MKEKKRVATCLEIEKACAVIWGWRQNMIVPNISWGAGIHECDLLVLSKAGWATEIEIKVSRSDLKKDAEKKHGHDSKKIKYLYFAIPDKLLNCIEFIPERAGIIAVYDNGSYGFRATVHRQPEANKEATKWTDKDRSNLGRLGCMRIWQLKSTVIGLINDRRLTAHETEKPSV